MSPEQFLLSVFLLAFSTHLAESLSCVQCNSVYSPSCLSSQNSMKHLYPCPSNRNYTLCRKIDQTVRGNRIVLRKCGWVVGVWFCPIINATFASLLGYWFPLLQDSFRWVQHQDLSLRRARMQQGWQGALRHWTVGHDCVFTFHICLIYCDLVTGKTIPCWVKPIWIHS